MEVRGLTEACRTTATCLQNDHCTFQRRTLHIHAAYRAVRTATLSAFIFPPSGARVVNLPMTHLASHFSSPSSSNRWNRRRLGCRQNGPFKLAGGTALPRLLDQFSLLTRENGTTHGVAVHDTGSADASLRAGQMTGE